MGMWDWLDEQYPAQGSRFGTNGAPPLAASDASALLKLIERGVAARGQADDDDASAAQTAREVGPRQWRMRCGRLRARRGCIDTSPGRFAAAHVAGAVQRVLGVVISAQSSFVIPSAAIACCAHQRAT